MKVLSILVFFLFIHTSYAQVTLEDITQWEKDVLDETKKLTKNKPDQEILFLISIAREYRAQEQNDKAEEYYRKVINHPYKMDITEAYVELITLNLHNKTKLKDILVKTKTWFKQTPLALTDSLEKWLKMVEDYSNDKLTKNPPAFYATWAKDQQIEKLIRKKDFKKAFEIHGIKNLKQANINDKVRYDLMSLINLGKDNSPPLWCKATLDRYPTSITWTMRVCRYLHDYKKNSQSKESILSIKQQMQEENSDRLSWIYMLEAL